MEQTKTIKQIVLNMLRNYERIWAENYVLKKMLRTSPIPSVRDTWKEQFERELADPRTAEFVHPKFAPHYAAISSALDRAKVLDLLRKMPLKGPVN